MSYTVTLNHIRYGRLKFDLAELKRRLETRLTAGTDAAKLTRILMNTERLMALLDVAGSGRHAKDVKARLDAEFALLLLGFEHVQAIMAGRSDQRRRPARKLRALPAPKKPTKKPTKKLPR